MTVNMVTGDVVCEPSFRTMPNGMLKRLMKLDLSSVLKLKELNVVTLSTTIHNYWTLPDGSLNMTKNLTGLDS